SSLQAAGRHCAAGHARLELRRDRRGRWMPDRHGAVPAALRDAAVGDPAPPLRGGDLMLSKGCHYSDARLRSFLDAELTPPEIQRMRDHLAGCRACQAKLGAMAEVSRLVGAAPVDVEPPPHFGTNLQLRLAGLRTRRAGGWGERGMSA